MAPFCGAAIRQCLYHNWRVGIDCRNISAANRPVIRRYGQYVDRSLDRVSGSLGTAFILLLLTKQIENRTVLFANSRSPLYAQNNSTTIMLLDIIGARCVGFMDPHGRNSCNTTERQNIELYVKAGIMERG